MLTMFQRQIGAVTNGLSRQGSSDLLASPSAISRVVSRNDSFSRRVPAGASSGTLPHSRSRPSLLVSCSGPSGPYGDSNASESSPSSEVQPQGLEEPRVQSQHNSPRISGNSMRAPQDPTAAALPPSSAYDPQQQSKQHQQTLDFTPEPFVPSPANLPTIEDEVLYPPRNLRPFHKGVWTLTDQPGIDLFLAGPLTWSRLQQVYVILFGVGERNTEGIYSLRASGSDGIPHETIIAFECEEEAQRYAGLLEASMKHMPQVFSIPPQELLSFCLDQTYSCRMEPKGSLLIPPDYHVRVTDWERSLRLREGQFAVLESEPELFGSAGGSGTTATATAPTTTTAAAPAAPPASGAVGSSGHHGSNLHGSGVHPSNLARYSGLSGSELDEIRARLESLLPRDEPPSSS